jgi:hypothetical protein
MMKLRAFHREQLQVARDFAGISIDANGEELFCIRRASREPNLFAPNHRR